MTDPDPSTALATMDEAARVRLGASPGTSMAVMRGLASDPSATVRASLAMNPALPAHLMAHLAVDSDPRVRGIAGRTLLGGPPGAAGGARQRRDAAAKLADLVAEAGLRVRGKLSEAVRDMPDAPLQIVLRLAHDPDAAVSGPVILRSPVLSSVDLVALVDSGPPSATLDAVARRARIDEAVSDAIAGAPDRSAVGALLRNRTARIRESTLDALAAQSEERTDWQEPLLRRPVLPPRSARILSEIAAPPLLRLLAAREDVDPRLVREMRAVAGAFPVGSADASPVGAVEEPGAMTPAAAMAQAGALRAAGRLDERVLLDALGRNALVQATAMLAVKADVPMPSVERAAEMRSAKAIVSLCWKAGLSMGSAVAAQAALARVPPNLLLRPTADGGYPIAADEMLTQLGGLGTGEVGLRAWTPRRLARAS